MYIWNVTSCAPYGFTLRSQKNNLGEYAALRNKNDSCCLIYLLYFSQHCTLHQLLPLACQKSLKGTRSPSRFLWKCLQNMWSLWNTWKTWKQTKTNCRDIAIPIETNHHPSLPHQPPIEVPQLEENVHSSMTSSKSDHLSPCTGGTKWYIWRNCCWYILIQDIL